MLGKGRGIRGGGAEKAELWSRAVEYISLAASPSSQLPQCELSDQLTTDPPGRNKCCMGSQNMARFPGGAGHQAALSLEIVSPQGSRPAEGATIPQGGTQDSPILPGETGTAEESGSPLPSCQLLN